MKYILARLNQEIKSKTIANTDIAFQFELFRSKLSCRAVNLISRLERNCGSAAIKCCELWGLGDWSKSRLSYYRV